MQLPSRRTGMPSWLYVLIVGSLGLYFIIGAVAWAIIAYEGRDVPDSFATILATIAGGLVGLLTPGPTGKGGDGAGEE